MKAMISLTFLLLLNVSGIDAQPNKHNGYFVIDSLLIQGEYSKTVDLCLKILEKDSLNPEIYYKLGLVYQNLMLSDKSYAAFKQAVKLAPENKKYNLSLAKFFYNSGKIELAEPIFTTLCLSDSSNWVFSYFLSEIYNQKGAYKKALSIYKRFYNQDTTNLSYLDKIGFCYLRMGNIDTAQVIFEKSLSLNNKNIPTLKNLSYIYFRKNMIDTAIYLLNRGIDYDSTDMDLYSRRANIYYTRNHHFKARPDYLRVLASGDSSKIVLKRLGIGFAYNDQPIDALGYLLAAFKKDSNDFETSSYIGQTYYKLKAYRKSIDYYYRVIKLLSLFTKQADYTNVLIADSYKDSCLYNEAITFYKKSLDMNYSPIICMNIANLYDEKLKNINKAIWYYQLFLNNLDENEFKFGGNYVENVKKRLNWLIKVKNKSQKSV